MCKDGTTTSVPCPFLLQVSQDGVSQDVSETVPRLPGELLITGKELVGLGVQNWRRSAGRPGGLCSTCSVQVREDK